MNEVAIRDLAEVKELNKQVMSSTVGGKGWCMGNQHMNPYANTFSFFGLPLGNFFNNNRFRFPIKNITQTNTQIQLAFVINSPNAVVNQNALVSQNAFVNQNTF
jgi:hypothetical protein